MDQVIVDIPAAAAALLAAQHAASSPATGGAPAVVAPGPEASTCQFGHPNPSGGKFCGECGLPVGVEVMDMDAALAVPTPADQLTPAERAQREAEHMRALAVNAAFASAEPEDFQPTQGPERVVVHFVDDGFTTLGQVWRRGQEISIGPDHPRWDDVVKWIMLTPDQQVARYGKQYFAPGPIRAQETAEQQALQVEVRRQMGRHQQVVLQNAAGVPDGELLEKRGR